METNYMIRDELIEQDLAKKVAKAELVWRLRQARSQGGVGLLSRALDAVRGVFSTVRRLPSAGQARERAAF